MSVYMLMIFSCVGLVFLKFIVNYGHLLVSLLCLEFVSLSVFFFFTYVLHMFNLEIFFMLYFLVMVVCEGVMGLALLVLLSFSYGQENMFSFNTLLC